MVLKEKGPDAFIEYLFTRNNGKKTILCRNAFYILLI
jgi:hypothetical protein